MHHHFTVDVEEYFQVAAFDGVVDRDAWPSFPSRVREPMFALLDLLAMSSARATFFFLGGVAERCPDLVRRTADGGHEVASHGWDHAQVDAQSPRAFRESVRRTKSVLEDMCGTVVRGFRAPSFSIRPWALEILAEEGHGYDSSVCPALRVDGNGQAGGARDPHWIRLSSGRIAEYPPAVFRRLGIGVPAGGAYFRVLPYAVTRQALRDCERRNVPGTFYLHPWELDPGQPRLAAPLLSRVRHYTALARTRPRLTRLLADFRFGRVCDAGVPA